MLKKCLASFIIVILVIGVVVPFAEVNGNYVTVKDENIYYQRLGNELSDKTVILVHGASGTGESLKLLASGLTDYNVILLDLPGHYRSEGEARTTMSEYAKFLKHFIKELRKDDVVTDDITLAGHSMGGAITLDTAINHNVQDIKRVIIINSGAKFNTITEDFVNQLGNGFYDPAFLEACFTPYTDPAVIEYFMANTDTLMADIEASYADFSTALVFDEVDKLHKVKVPTLILAGEMDNITPLEGAEVLDEEIKDSQLISYPKVGHMLPAERPQEIAEDIIEFIESN